MSNKQDFIETVKSKGILRTIKHVISKRKLEDADIIVVRVLCADTLYQEDIAHLVVEDEHPDAQGKKGHPLNVFISGDFPHKDIPFHEGELIGLGGGWISENEKGNLELVFASENQNTILREDFWRCNKEDIFSKTAKFLIVGRKLSNENVEVIEKIKNWIGCGLVAAEPKELSLNEASLKTVCRCNLVCKVLDVREIVPCLGVITVIDGSVCRHPFLTINNNKEVEFLLVDESNLAVDIIVTLKTEDLKSLKKGSYVRLFGIQAKRFSVPLSNHEECVIFKIDGRIFSFESLVGSDRVNISKFLHEKNQHNTTADVPHNIADDPATHLPVASPSNESFTILRSCPQQKATPSDDVVDDDSQSILRPSAPPTKLKGSDNLSKFPRRTRQSLHVRHKRHPFSGEQKGRSNSWEEWEHVEPDDDDVVDNRNKGQCSTLYRAGPSKTHKIRHRGVAESCAVPMRGHCARGCSTTERSQCETSALNQRREHVRPEIIGRTAVQDSVTDGESADDDPLVLERQIGLRRLKCVPGVYHVNVWIKDVSPNLSGCPLDLITARCYTCRKEQIYTKIIKQQPHPEQQICVPCSSQGMPKFLELQFKFTLILWDVCQREISASVSGEEAEKFLNCSVYTYTRDEAMRQLVWNALRKLKDRGCVRKYCHVQDQIEVDIGVTVERGLKKYMLLDGVLNTLELSHKQ